MLEISNIEGHLFCAKNKIIHTKINKDARDYKNVKVYVADPWSNAQPGFVKNIRISGKINSEVKPSVHKSKLYFTFDWSKI